MSDGVDSSDSTGVWISVSCIWLSSWVTVCRAGVYSRVMALLSDHMEVVELLTGHNSGTANPMDATFLIR
jgi:hypothetical protein